MKKNKLVILNLIQDLYRFRIKSGMTAIYLAQVNIGQHFGFGDIKSLGDGTTRIIGPMFDIAAFLVILYFLLGAFKFLRAGGNKEEVEGGRQIINHAIIGFILLMSAFLILQFIPQYFNLPGIDIIR